MNDEQLIEALLGEGEQFLAGAEGIGVENAAGASDASRAEKNWRRTRPDSCQRTHLRWQDPRLLPVLQKPACQSPPCFCSQPDFVWPT